MVIVTLDEMKAHLGVTLDDDDAMISDLIDEAQSFIEGQVGYPLDEASPADLVLAVKAQAAHFYENREASMVGVSIAAVPFSVEDIIRNRRNYSWGVVDGEG